MKQLTRLLLLAAFATLIVAPSVWGASTVKSGVHGSVRRGPTQPTCEAGTPCTAPVANAMVVFARGGVVHHVRTDAHGRYTINLAPGRYAVHVAGNHMTYSPHSASVRQARMSTTNIVIDTGIR